MHRRFLIIGVVVSILLGSLLYPLSSSALESLDTITFPTTIYAYPEEVEIQLNLNIGVDPTSPSQLSPGQSTDVSVHCYSQVADATLEWIGKPFMPREANFLTPLGDSDKIYLGAFSIAELKYYVEFANAFVLMDIDLQGNGSVSPSSLEWSSFGTKSFTVSHTGSTSSRELLKLRLDFKYIGILTVFTTDILYGIIINQSVQRVEIDSLHYFSTDIEVVPGQGIEPLMIVSMVILLSGVSLVSISLWGYSRRRKVSEQKGWQSVVQREYA